VRQITIHPRLRQFVENVSLDLSADRDRYRVLPGPYPVVGCQYRGAIAVLRDGESRRLSPAGLTGLQAETRWFAPEPETSSILVRLKPAAAGALFGPGMRDVAGEHVGLDLLSPFRLVRESLDRVVNAPSAEEAADLFQGFLLDLLDRRPRQPRPAAAFAAERILSSRGNCRIDRLAREAAISGRQLERLFLAEVGISPKEFASICRFDWVIRNLRPGVSWAELALDAGYSDQAHLIRNFVGRTGQTPARFQ
jgi:AraC-like DNA-binding protein